MNIWGKEHEKMSESGWIIILSVVIGFVIIFVTLLIQDSRYKKTEYVSSSKVESTVSKTVSKDEKTEESLLGNGIPVKMYRTLNDAEESFGYYLGLHNTVIVNNNEKDTDVFKLTSVIIIDKKVMQGVYESKNGELFTVKTSKSQGIQDMLRVYQSDNEVKTNKSTEYIHGIKVITYKKDNKTTTACFSAGNTGKDYVIHCKAGLKVKCFDNIIEQLILNVESMKDYN